MVQVTQKNIPHKNYRTVITYPHIWLSLFNPKKVHFWRISW